MLNPISNVLADRICNQCIAENTRVVTKYVCFSKPFQFYIFVTKEWYAIWNESNIADPRQIIGDKQKKRKVCSVTRTPVFLSLSSSRSLFRRIYFLLTIAVILVIILAAIGILVIVLLKSMGLSSFIWIV